MRSGIGTAVLAASLLLASCGGSTVGPGNAGTGTAGTGTASAGSSTSRTTTTSTTTTSTTTTSATTTRPTPTTTSPAPPPLLPTSGTGAYGYVTAGPTCPVERPGHPCPPRPVSDDVDVRDVNGATVASTHSDSHGRYTIDLSPGSYTLVVVTRSGRPRCPETQVSVRPGSATRADISCDTGIR